MRDFYKVIASCVITDSQNRVLLGKRSMSEEVFPGLWGIPGGKVEYDAISKQVLEDNLVREAREEMGIEIRPEKYLCSNFNKEGTKLYIIFTAKHVSGEPRALEDTEEVKWWNVDDIRSLDLTPNTLDNIKLAISRS